MHSVLSPIAASLHQLHERYRDLREGSVATYIPELAKANPDWFAICIVTTDGHGYQVGDHDVPFTIQSISKPFVFGHAVGEHGRDAVLARVGVEPSGDAFNAIVFDDVSKRPYNPMVNAGAIATSALVGGQGLADRLQRIHRMFAAYAGHPLALDQAVFASERATGHRNRAIAHLMLNFDMIDERVDEHLDLYFQQCSLLVTCRDLAVMAATLANGGVNPLTGATAAAPEQVRDILSVMNSCGMYDYAGEWSYKIGMPAKSGVAGGIIAVLPGQAGIGVFSPRLDSRGNSLRGIKVCEELSEKFGFHVFGPRAGRRSVFRRRYHGNQVTSLRFRTRDEREVLDREGGATAVYELQGQLYFASVEELVRQVHSDADALTWLILDWRHVTGLDQAGARLLHQLASELHRAGKTLLLSHLGVQCQQVLASAGPALGEGPAPFADQDAALEWCEDQILRGQGGIAESHELAFASLGLCAGLSAEDMALLREAALITRHAAGDVLFREGDAAEHLYVVAKGRVTILVGVDGQRSRRLCSIGAGVAFGEMALLDGGARSADAIADGEVMCYALPIARVIELGGKRPQILARLLLNLGADLSTRLRWRTAELRALDAGPSAG